MRAEPIRWIGFAVGILAVLGTTASMVHTLIVPRAVRARISVIAERAVRRVFLTIAARARDYRLQDRILALQAPMTLLVVLVVWLTLFLVAYALVLWPLGTASFAAALRESGSAMLTLGFAAPESAARTAVHFASAATGLVVIALQIAYLPTLYSAFNRRETTVTMLQSRAGAPAWGPEILARHQLVAILDSLRDLYAEWERWAADVAESHGNYPVLVSFRSPHPLRSWVLGLLAVLDAAALHNALAPRTAPSETRLCLRMGFTCLRDIATVLRMPFDPDPKPDDPIQLSYEEYMEGVRRLEEVGFAMERTPEEAWPHFRGWRVNYEAIAYALADRVGAPPAAWSGSRTTVSAEIIPLQRPYDRRPGEPDAGEPVPSRRWLV